MFESESGTYSNTINLNDSIKNYKRIKVFYGSNTTSSNIVSADCLEFLPTASTIVLNAITYIGNQGGASITLAAHTITTAICVSLLVSRIDHCHVNVYGLSNACNNL